MYQTLVNNLKAFADTQTEEVFKQYYNDIAEALSDDEFMATFTGTGMTSLTNNLNNLQAYSSNPAYFKNNTYAEYLSKVHFAHISYRADKKRNIGIFSQKIRAFDAKLNDMNANIDAKIEASGVKIDENNQVIDAKLKDSSASIDERIKESNDAIEAEIQDNRDTIDKIKNIAKVITGATALVAYAGEFDNQAAEHRKTAKKWLWWLIGSVIVFIGVVAALLFVQISNLPIIKDWLADDLTSLGALNVAALVIKGAIIIAYIQVPLFFRKNYFAEKHLEQASIHRRNVLKALHAVYETLDDKTEKDKIITVGASIAFSEPESGFITRKEGAGGEDSVETILKMFRK